MSSGKCYVILKLLIQIYKKKMMARAYFDVPEFEGSTRQTYLRLNCFLIALKKIFPNSSFVMHHQTYRTF